MYGWACRLATKLLSGCTRDDTRNRSKRYCDDKLCGNLTKVRRFRARKKAEATAAGGFRDSSDDSSS